MVAAGVLVGVVAGAMLFSGGDHDAPEQAAQAPAETRPVETASNAPDVKPETAKASEQTAPTATAQPATPPVDASPVALVYIRILDGETLKVNGEPKHCVRQITVMHRLSYLRARPELNCRATGKRVPRRWISRSLAPGW